MDVHKSAHHKAYNHNGLQALPGTLNTRGCSLSHHIRIFDHSVLITIYKNRGGGKDAIRKRHKLK